MSSSSLLPRGAVQFDRVSKRYPIATTRGSWRNAIPSSIFHRPPGGNVAVDEFSVSIEPGEAVGIIGPNGAGKSTLLKLLTGVIGATSGRVAHGGTVGSMIELGLGFHPDLTGWENLRAGGRLLGLTRSELARRSGEIVEFAGLADAMNTQLKHFSTGMMARLGFSLATHVDAAVLAVDEVLAVGDREFQERCLERIRQLVASGTTVLFVSHELPLVGLACDRVLRLDRGRLIDDGPATDVIEGYLGRPTRVRVPGPQPVEIVGVRIGSPTLDIDEPIEITVDLDVREPMAGPPPTLVTDITLPSLLPGIPVAEHTTPLDIDGGRIGPLRLRGTTSRLPWAGGQLRLTVSLATGVRSVSSSAHVDLTIAGSTRTAKPMYRIRPTVELEPITDHATRQRSDRGGSPSADPIVASASQVTKRFRSGRSRSAVRAALPGSWGRTSKGDILALDRVDLAVHRGERVGLIGPNGAGKSTLLRAMSGLHQLDGGEVVVHGRLVGLFQLGIGFHPDLTGIENLRLTSTLYGTDRAEIDALLPDIVEFAGIGDAIDRPVKRYSTGMRARLGFALATHVPADLLLIDELLAVGDQEFRARALERITELSEQGLSILFVSHNLTLISQVCTRTVWLEDGKVVADGPTRDILDSYGGTGWAAGPAIGTGPVRLHRLELGQSLLKIGDSLTFTCEVELTAPLPHARVELSLRAPHDRGRSEALTREEIEMASAAHAVLLQESALGTPGWYRLRGHTGRLEGTGSLDLTVSIVDAFSGEAIAEAWQPFQIGRTTNGAGEVPRINFSVEWAGADELERATP